MRRLVVRREVWTLAKPFVIARGRKDAAHVVVAELFEDGHVGRGECVPYARYGESVDEVVAAIEGLANALESGLDRRQLQSLLPAGAARNALDCALWDLEAKQSGRPAWMRAGVPLPHTVVSAETIGIDTLAAMREAAEHFATRPLLKIKVDATDVVDRVATVRAAAPAARLIVDANESWDAALLRQVSPALAGLRVAVIEQPIPADEERKLDGWTSPVTLCADESCHTVADLTTLAPIYRMVNIKLDKAGGLTEALSMLAAARTHGLGLMVGCMVSTSLAIAPALVLAGAAALVDLDGPLWLAYDREPALRFDDGYLSPADRDLWG